MADPVFNSGTNTWDLTTESATVTAAEAPTNSDATTDVPSHYEICDRTGFRVLPGELVEEWNGLRVRKRSFTKRHPQDFVRGVSEQLKGSQRPEQTDRFLTTNEVQASDL